MKIITRCRKNPQDDDLTCTWDKILFHHILNNFHQFLELVECTFVRRDSSLLCMTDNSHSSYRRVHRAKKQNYIHHNHLYDNQKCIQYIDAMSCTPYKMELTMKARVRNIYFSKAYIPHSMMYIHQFNGYIPSIPEELVSIDCDGDSIDRHISRTYAHALKYNSINMFQKQCHQKLYMYCYSN